MQGNIIAPRRCKGATQLSLQCCSVVTTCADDLKRPGGVAVLERQLDAGDRRITPAIIARLGDLLRRKLDEPDGGTRKEYIHLLVHRVEVGDREVRKPVAT